MTNVVRPAHDLAQRRLDLLLGRRVDRRRRVVEDQDPRVGQERARDRDALALAAAERQPALADARLVALGQPLDEVVGLCAPRGQLDLLRRRVRPGVGDVLAHRRAEQERGVVDDAIAARSDAGSTDAHVDAVDEHRARDRRRTAAEAAAPASSCPSRSRRRARPCGPRRRRARRRGAPARRCPRSSASTSRSSTRAGAVRQRRRAGRRHDPRLAVEDLEQARAGGGRALGQPEQHAERAHRRQQHAAGRRRTRVKSPIVSEPCDRRGGRRRAGRRESELGQEADERVVEGLQPRRDHRLVEHARPTGCEALELAVLARERLDDAHAARCSPRPRRSARRSAAGPPGRPGARCARSAAR